MKDAWCCLLVFAPPSCHLAMNRWAASRLNPVSRAHLIFCSGSQRSLNYKHQRGALRVSLGCSDHFEVVKKAFIPSLRLTAWSWTFPTGLRRNCRTMAGAKKTRRLLMVVSMLSHPAFLRAFVHERVAWSLSALKVNDSKRTW